MDMALHPRVLVQMCKMTFGELFEQRSLPSLVTEALRVWAPVWGLGRACLRLPGTSCTASAPRLAVGWFHLKQPLSAHGAGEGLMPGGSGWWDRCHRLEALPGSFLSLRGLLEMGRRY